MLSSMASGNDWKALPVLAAQSRTWSLSLSSQHCNSAKRDRVDSDQEKKSAMIPTASNPEITGSPKKLAYMVWFKTHLSDTRVICEASLKSKNYIRTQSCKSPALLPFCHSTLNLPQVLCLRFATHLGLQIQKTCGNGLKDQLHLFQTALATFEVTAKSLLSNPNFPGIDLWQLQCIPFPHPEIKRQVTSKAKTCFGLQSGFAQCAASKLCQMRC